MLYLANKTEFEFQSFGFLFIIPAGSLIIGFLVGAAYIFPLKILNVKIYKIDVLFTVIFSMLVAINLYYWYYANTYISNDGNIVYSAKNATPISQYTIKENNEPVDFINYMILTINNRQISIFYRVPTIALATTPENSIIGWANFIIEILGYIIGGLLSIKIIISAVFCDRCKLYYKTIHLLKRSIEDADQIIVGLENAIKSGSNLVDFFKLKNDTSGIINMIFESTSCPSCGDGLFVTRVEIKNKSGEYKTINDLSQYLITKNDQVIKGNFQGIELLKALKQVNLENPK